MSVLDSAVVREHELQAVLKQKDFELDERDRLLQKSKVVIEQLQEELQYTRQELDDNEKRVRLKDKILSEQQSNTHGLKDRAAALQLEVECKESEIMAVQEALTVRLSELERKKAEFREFRDKSGAQQRQLSEAALRAKEDVVVLTQRLDVADRAKQETRQELEHCQIKVSSLEIVVKERDAALKALKEKHFMLQGDLEAVKGHLSEEKNHTRSLEEDRGHLRSQLKVAKSEITALQADIEDLTAQKKTALKAEQALRDAGSSLESELQSCRKSLDGLQAELDSKVKEAADAVELAAHRALDKEEADRKWAESLRSATSKFEDTILEAERQWVQKVGEIESDWAKKFEVAEREWSTEKESLKTEAETEHRQTESFWATKLDTLKQQMSDEKTEADKLLQIEKSRLESLHSQSLQAAQSQWVAEKVTIEQRWNDEKRGAEAQFMQQMEYTKQQCKAEKDELNERWHTRMSEAERAWAEEKAAMEAAWTARLEEAEVLAMRQQDALRMELDGWVGSVSTRLQELAHKEGERERKRQELSMMVEELKDINDSEYDRRLSAELAIHKVSEAFNREMDEKNRELESLQDELSLSRSMLEASTMRDLSGSARRRSAAALSSHPSTVPYGRRSPSPIRGRSPSPVKRAGLERDFDRVVQGGHEFERITAEAEATRSECLSRVNRKMTSLSAPTSPELRPLPSPVAPDSAGHGALGNAAQWGVTRAELSHHLRTAPGRMEAENDSSF